MSYFAIETVPSNEKATSPQQPPTRFSAEFTDAGISGVVNGSYAPNHYVASALDLSGQEPIVRLLADWSGAPIQAGIVRDSEEDGRLVMTEPASGDIQRWDLDPRTTVVVADGDMPEGILPWGLAYNAILSFDGPEHRVSVQINNPSSTGGLVMASAIAGTLRVHINDPHSAT